MLVLLTVTLAPPGDGKIRRTASAAPTLPTPPRRDHPNLAGFTSATEGTSPSTSPEPFRVAVSHLLVRHERSFLKLSRPLAEARALARKLADRARRAPDNFASLVDEFGEDEARRASSGYLGVFRRGELAAEFRPLEDALFALSVGNIAGPIETPLGLHIVRREPLKEWAGRHLLVQYRGAPRATASSTRSRAEARRIAEDLLRRAREPGASFATLARRYSEAPDRVQAGSLGVFTPHEILPEIEAAIDSLAEGEVGGPVESPLGFHLVRRLPVERRHLAIILLRSSPQPATPPTGATRDGEATTPGVLELAKVLATHPERFAALAKEHSSHPSRRFGGDIGNIAIDSLPHGLGDAARRLAPGEVSPPRPTPEGTFFLRRLTAEDRR